MNSPVTLVTTVNSTNRRPLVVRIPISPKRASATMPASTATSAMTVWNAPKAVRLNLSSMILFSSSLLLRGPDHFLSFRHLPSASQRLEQVDRRHQPVIARLRQRKIYRQQV